jgi:hypothetical protein
VLTCRACTKRHVAVRRRKRSIVPSSSSLHATLPPTTRARWLPTRWRLQTAPLWALAVAVLSVWAWRARSTATTTPLKTRNTNARMQCE